MYAKDAIRITLNFSHDITLRSLDQIQDVPLTFPTPNGGCHPLWIVGHLAFVEGLTHRLITGGENPLADWAPLFAPDTIPSADATQYPPFAEVRARYVELRQKNMELLDSMSEADLDRRTANPPKGVEQHFETHGKVFLFLGMHQMMHRGQLADAIRAAGRTLRLGPPRKEEAAEAVAA